jgi:hypothetical protein
MVVLFDYHLTRIELQNRTFSQTCPLEQLELGTTSNIANNNSKSPFIGGQNFLLMIHQHSLSTVVAIIAIGWLCHPEADFRTFTAMEEECLLCCCRC